MSPPTPVLTRGDIRRLYVGQLSNPQEYECSLKSLSQHECTFVVSADSSVVQKTICIPFKRVFQRCLVPYVKTIEGKKHSGKRWINIEVTDVETNDPKAVYGSEVEEFLKAEQELTKWMEKTMDKQK